MFKLGLLLKNYLQRTRTL